MDEKEKMSQDNKDSITDEGRKLEQEGLESLKQNKPADAENSFLKALAKMEESGDQMGQAYLLGNLGNLCFQSQRLDQAEAYYNKSMALMEVGKDIRGIESSLGNLANIDFYKENFDEAATRIKMIEMEEKWTKAPGIPSSPKKLTKEEYLDLIKGIIK